MNISSISEIVDAHPRETLSRIEETCAETDLSFGIDWEVVGQYAATQAYNSFIENDTEKAFDWSKLGVEVYRRLKSIKRPIDNELAEMRLRANAIVYCGVDRSNSLLDPAVIETWFFELIQDTIEETRQQLSDVENVLSEKFEDLRLLKERLTIIEGLVERSVFQRNTELAKWVVLLNELP